MRVGDILVLVNGEYVIIEKIQHEILETPVKVYNFNVEDFHTYYVGEQGVLVHNKCHGKDIQLAKPGQDLYVGSYSKSSYWNRKTGLNATHTPHHAVQDAISSTSHGKGITINIRKDIHLQTGTYGSLRSGLTNRQHLAADVFELRTLLKEAGYDRSVINAQLKELIRQNIALGGFGK